MQKPFYHPHSSNDGSKAAAADQASPRSNHAGNPLYSTGVQQVRNNVVQRIRNIPYEIQGLLLVAEEGLEFWANELIRKEETKKKKKKRGK
jgi:hypothetical protein